MGVLMTGSDGILSRRTAFFTGLTSVAALAASTIPEAEASPAVAQSAGVKELLDKHAITECIYKYPRGLDRLDRDILMSIGHPDAKIAFRDTPFQNWAAYVDWFLKAHTDMIANNHRITNILIELHGDTAASESSGTATLLAHTSDPDQVEERWMHSRYLDKWLRRDGVWGIISRTTIIDYRRISLVPAADLKTRYDIGKRDGHNDPSYRLFGQM